MSCSHPATALRSWIANDPTTRTGTTIVIVCTKCRTILKGGAS